MRMTAGVTNPTPVVKNKNKKSVLPLREQDLGGKPLTQAVARNSFPCDSRILGVCVMIVEAS